jgi:mycofactocin system glycosyltransferase
VRPDLPDAPSPVEVPLAPGTRVELDEGVVFVDDDLLSGGSPWRLLRLPGSSRGLAERWRRGGRVGVGEERFARTLVQRGLLHPRFDGDDAVDDVDVIVPAFADADSLAALLDQLPGLHVTVVDDASPDAAAIARVANRYGARLVRLENNRGPGGARNAGAAATSRMLLWFLDHDVGVEDARMVLARLRAPLRDPLVAAVAPRLVGAGGPRWRERFETRWSPLDQGPRSALVVPGGPVGYVPSASLVVRRAAYGDGYDEALRVGEDVDFVWRLSDHGWLVRYDAGVTVTHRTRPTWRAWFRQRLAYGESSADLAIVHGSRLAPMRADVWTLLAWGAVAAGRPAVGAQIVRAAQRHARDRVFAGADDPAGVARAVVGRNMARAGGPLARALVRTFGTLLLVAALHPRLRARALAIFALGTAWRWHGRRVHVADVPLAVADDLVYGVGVTRGAWRRRTLDPPSMHWREVLGLPSRAAPLPTPSP